MARPLWAAVGVACFVVSALVAVAASLVSRMCWRVHPVTLPYGMVLAVAASLSVVLIARSFSRGLAFVAAVGWLVGLGYVVNGTPGGGFLIASDAFGWGFMILGTAAALGGALWGSFSSRNR